MKLESKRETRAVDDDGGLAIVDENEEGKVS